MAELWEAARRAFPATNFDPEKRAAQYIQKYEKLLLDDLKEIPQDEQGQYTAKFKKSVAALFAKHSRIMSAAITGPARFPTERNRKANNSYDSAAAEFQSWKITRIDHLYYDEIIRCLLQAFLYQTAHVLDNHVEAETTAEEPLQSRHQICQAFIDLFSSTKPVPRSVQWYAERLCKTPRYLSTAVKRASGRSASEWIHEALTREVADALKNSPKSIKEISDELDFPNLSFFGRYVRQRLGCSPSEFRQRKNNPQ